MGKDRRNMQNNIKYPIWYLVFNGRNKFLLDFFNCIYKVVQIISLGIHCICNVC